MGGGDSKPQEQPRSPPSTPPLLSRPWRVSPLLDKQLLSMLQTSIENYCLPSHLNSKQARILMLGVVGAGKSSFFNTINSIFQERITQQANAGSAPGSLTMMYRQYQVRSKATGKPLNFRLCDTCGIESDKGPDLVDLNYLLEGNVPDGYQFGATPINPSIEGFIHQPGPQDKIHCVAFVFEASSVKVITNNTWEKLDQLQGRMNSRGIPRVILLTKIDKLSQTIEEDVSRVFLSTHVKKAVNFVSERLRVPAGNVMPIKNYDNELNPDIQVSCLALQALDRMLGYANDFLVNQHDLMELK